MPSYLDSELYASFTGFLEERSSIGFVEELRPVMLTVTAESSLLKDWFFKEALFVCLDMRSNIEEVLRMSFGVAHLL